MKYPCNLIRDYQCNAISREAFCRAYAEQQGFDNSVRGFCDQSGAYVEYRGRKVALRNGLLWWQEQGKQYAVLSIKEMKIIVDTHVLRAAA